MAFRMLWNLIEQDLGIHRTKKKQTQEEIEKLDEKLRLTSGKILDIELYDIPWSPQARDLKEIIEKVGVNSTLVNRGDFILNSFTELCLTNLQINTIEVEFKKLNQLLILNLSFNQLSMLSNLPPQLQELDAYGNQITTICNMQLPELLHLGIGYNLLESIENLDSMAPQLMSLDITFNHLTSIEILYQQLHHLSNLKQVKVFGNPFTLNPGYLDFLLEALTQVNNIDNKDRLPSEKHIKSVANLSMRQQSQHQQSQQQQAQSPTLTSRSKFNFSKQMQKYEVQINIGAAKWDGNMQLVFQWTDLLFKTDEVELWEADRKVLDFEAVFKIPVQYDVAFRDQILQGVTFTVMSGGEKSGLVHIPLDKWMKQGEQTQSVQEPQETQESHQQKQLLQQIQGIFPIFPYEIIPEYFLQHRSHPNVCSDNNWDPIDPELVAEREEQKKKEKKDQGKVKKEDKAKLNPAQQQQISSMNEESKREVVIPEWEKMCKKYQMKKYRGHSNETIEFEASENWVCIEITLSLEEEEQTVEIENQNQ